MRTMLMIIAVLAVSGLFVADAAAQTTTFSVFFDDKFTQGSKDCPGSGVLDTLYVVGSGFNALVSGAEYRITYPASLTWLSDSNTPPVAIGNSPTGISLGFPSPQNGFQAVLFHTVTVLWNCSGCGGFENGGIVVGPSLVSGASTPEWTDWPSFDLFSAVGMTSLVCATVRTEESTWGQIKSLYQD